MRKYHELTTILLQAEAMCNISHYRDSLRELGLSLHRVTVAYLWECMQSGWEFRHFRGKSIWPSLHMDYVLKHFFNTNIKLMLH